MNAMQKQVKDAKHKAKVWRKKFTENQQNNIPSPPQGYQNYQGLLLKAFHPPQGHNYLPSYPPHCYHNNGRGQHHSGSGQG